MLETPARPQQVGPPPLAASLPVAPHIRAGSVADAKALRARLQQVLAATERAEETLAVLAATAQEKKIYLVLEDERGRYFPDWTAFCTARAPWGLGLAAAVVARLVEEHRDPRRRARLVLEAPLLLRARGGVPGHAPTRAPEAPPKRRRLNGADYLAQRLKRDFPELLEQVATGALPSIAAAAEQAGLKQRKLRVLANPMAVARLIVATFDAAGQREVVDLIEHPERITAPPGANSTAWKRYREATTPPDELARARAAHREAVATGRREREAARGRERRARAPER
jgi:hypothetical protein